MHIYTACCSHLDGLLGDKQEGDFVLKIRQQEAQNPVVLAIAGDHDVVPVVFCAVFGLRKSIRKNGGIDASMNASIDERKYERTNERMGG
jgi:hypothetical protein